MRRVIFLFQYPFFLLNIRLSQLTRVRVRAIVGRNSVEVMVAAAIAYFYQRLSQRLITRATPLERPLRFILVFTDDAHAHRKLLHTGYHEKI
jgi:hypothetical protein